MEIMELREEIDSCQSAGDEETVKELQERVRSHIESATAELSRAFRENDLAQAKELVIRLSYYQRAREKLSETSSA